MEQLPTDNSNSNSNSNINELKKKIEKETMEKTVIHRNTEFKNPVDACKDIESVIKSGFDEYTEKTGKKGMTYLQLREMFG